MAEFETRDNGLYIDGQRVLRGWESWNGWYWFGTEQNRVQDTVLAGRVYENDPIWFGLVQGFEEEWGYWSQAELETLKPKVWEIKPDDLPHAGRRDE